MAERFSLADMTWPEVAEAQRVAPVAIVPLGSCEQHAYGMALRTDTTRAEAVAGLVAERISPLVVVAPALPVGVSEHHMAFPGTITLSPNTLQQAVWEMVDSLYRHGWRRIFVLTGHGGNSSAVDLAGLRLRTDHPDLHVAWSGVTPLASAVAKDLRVSEVGGHSGEIETSQSLYLDPTLVRPDRLRRGASTVEDLDTAGRLSRSDPAIHFPQDYRRLSAGGGLGDPRAASAEIGRQLVEQIVERLSTFLERFAELPDRLETDRPLTEAVSPTLEVTS